MGATSLESALRQMAGEAAAAAAVVAPPQASEAAPSSNATVAEANAAARGAPPVHARCEVENAPQLLIGDKEDQESSSSSDDSELDAAKSMSTKPAHLAGARPLPQPPSHCSCCGRRARKFGRRLLRGLKRSAMLFGAAVQGCTKWHWLHMINLIM